MLVYGMCFKFCSKIKINEKFQKLLLCALHYLKKLKFPTVAFLSTRSFLQNKNRFTEERNDFGSQALHCSSTH